MAGGCRTVLEGSRQNFASGWERPGGWVEGPRLERDLRVWSRVPAEDQTRHQIVLAVGYFRYE